MNFEQKFTGQLVHAEPNEMVDRQSGEVIRWHTLEIVGDVNGVKRCIIGSAGDRAVNGLELKPGTKVSGIIAPGKARNSTRVVQIHGI